MQVEVLKKISVKTLGLQDAAKGTRKSEKPVKLMQVYGMATGVKTGETDFGEYTKLLGQFEAKTLLGEQKLFRSHALFLPGGLDELISTALQGMDQSAKGVQFAFEIGAEPDTDPRSQIGYKYTAINLIEPAKNDLLSEMRQQVLGNGAAQIEAPEHPTLEAKQEANEAYGTFAPTPEAEKAAASAGASQHSKGSQQQTRKR